MTLADLKKKSDRQLAKLMDGMFDTEKIEREMSEPHALVICEVTYRLLRANGRRLTDRQERQLDRVAVRQLAPRGGGRLSAVGFAPTVKVAADRVGGGRK